MSTPAPDFALPAQLTMAVAAAAHAQVQAALAQRSGTVTVDAGALQEFDTAALAILLEAGRVCQSRGGSLAIAHPPAKLSQLAALYGVDGLLGLQPG